MRRGLIFLAAAAAACGTLTTGTQDFRAQSLPPWDPGRSEPLEYLGGDWYREIQPLYGGPGYWGGLSPWGWGGLSPWGYGGYGGLSPWGYGGYGGYGGLSPWGYGGYGGYGGASPWGWGSMPGMNLGPSMWPPQAGQPMPTAYPTGTPTPMPANGLRPPLRDPGADAISSSIWGR